MAAPGVFANDGLRLPPTVIDPPRFGNLQLGFDGSFTYTPFANYVGSDSFRYSNGVDAATVALTVEPINDAPEVILNGWCDKGEDGLNVCPVTVPAPDVRHVELGDPVEVSGRISDPEFDAGVLEVTWGDGTQDSYPYPCEGDNCAFTLVPPSCSTAPDGSLTCAVGYLRFRLEHVYSRLPDGSPYFDITVNATEQDGTKTTAETQARVRDVRDEVPPAITADATKADGTPYVSGTWSTQPVTVTFTCSDNSGVVTCPESVTAPEGVTPSVNGTATDPSGNSTSTSFGPIWVDTVGPEVTTTATSNGQAYSSGSWANSDVTVKFDCQDSGSGVSTCPVGLDVGSEGTTLVLREATDVAGNTSAGSITVRVDKTEPVFDACPSGGPFLLNDDPPMVNIQASDARSGIDAAASSLEGSVSTTSIGEKTVRFVAADNAGNTASKDCSYSVVSAVSDFAAPVDMDAVNKAKAGQTVPFKFTVTDANGSPVTDLTQVSTTSVAYSCEPGVPVDAIEEYATGGSGLQNFGDGTYQFNFKTKKGWAGSCRTLGIELGDGVNHKAKFQFK